MKCINVHDDPVRSMMRRLLILKSNRSNISCRSFQLFFFWFTFLTAPPPAPYTPIQNQSLVKTLIKTHVKISANEMSAYGGGVVFFHLFANMQYHCLIYFAMIIYLRGAFYFATQNEALNNSIKHSTVLDRQLAILMQRVKN